MKTTFLLCAVLLPLAASAQKLQATAPPAEYEVNKKAFLYRTPADTAAGTSSYFLYPSEEATIVGEFSPRWAIAKRTGFLFLISIKDIRDYKSDLLPTDPETKQFTYQAVNEVAGVNKADLFSRAFEWVAQSYNSAQNVVQMQDKEAGKIIIKAIHSVSSKGYDTGTVSYTLSIYVKDGRYKYILTDFIHKAPVLSKEIHSGGALENTQPKVALFKSAKIWMDIRRSTDLRSRLLIRSLESAMTLKGAKDPSDF